QRRAGARGRRRDPQRHGRHPPQAVARHQRDLPLRGRRVRGAAGRDLQERRAPLRRPHPLRALDVDLLPRPPGDRELRHRVPARGRGARRRRADPRRRRGALRGQARGQESRLRPRGHRRRSRGPARRVMVPGLPAVSPGAGNRRVLIVDDEADIRTTLRAAFGAAGYECRMAGNGGEAVALFDRERAPLTITDLKMPTMDGLELLRHVRGRDSDAAVIMLTGAADVATAVASLKQGASDFIVKPVDLDQVLLSAERALERRQLLIERREHQALLEYRVAEATRDLSAALGELQQTYQATLEALGSALATREVGTELHSRRVHAYSIALARAHRLPEGELEALGRAVLLKPGPLTHEEWQVMRRHPEVGRQLLERIPFLRDAIPVVYHHHERWDGTGYPEGLAGSAIPLAARIFAVADAFDALTVDRPYSTAVSMAAARERIREASGTHFDPEVVATFLALPIDLFEKARAASPARSDA